MRRIGGIVLAAGGSTRLGEPKQLLEFDGECLVHAAVRAAQEGGCETVWVVTGHARELIEGAVADLHPLLVHNEHWQRGMGSSAKAGLRAIGPVSAVVLLACDQPAVNGQIIRSLLTQYDRTRSAIVASRYLDTLGIPTLFDESCFGELQRLPDDRGAKAVIQAIPARVSFVDFPGGAADLDTPAQVRAWRHGGSAHAHVSSINGQ